MRRTKSVTRATLLVCSLFALGAFAQNGTAVLTGNITDAATGKPVGDVVVTATSPQLQGEEIVVSDASGLYRIPNLPPGKYKLHLEKESFHVYERGDIDLRVDRTTRLNVQFAPDALQSAEIIVNGRPPTIDVGSTTTGVNVGQDFVNHLALVRPGASNSGTRSFESLANVAPGVNADTYGFSVSGTTSPENQFVIDGLSVNDPAFGILGTPLSVEFVQDVNVITGGYMPEFGRATGGIMNVVTKSGSNEFHGSVFGNWSPGALNGPSPTINSSASSVSATARPFNLGDFGVEIGGPILKDRLWFFAGFNPSFARTQVTRQYNQFTDCNGDGVIDSKDLDKDGFACHSKLPDSTKNFFADNRSYQYIGKLTFLINADHNITLSVYGSPSSSGGPTTLGISPQSGGIDAINLGDFGAVTTRDYQNANDVSLKYSGSFLDKRLLLDATVGWHHQEVGTLPSDGSNVGDTTGLASAPSVIYRRTVGGPHALTEFVDLSPAAQAACGATLAEQQIRCPVNQYVTGGAGFESVAKLDRYQGKLVGTLLLTALGHHVIKAGLDIEVMDYTHTTAYSGGDVLRESTSGATFSDFRQFAYYTQPDQVQVQTAYQSTVHSTTIGGFLQDSWSIADLITLNAGLRYDAQQIVGGDGNIGMSLPNELSPRIGLIYDFTQSGRSKIYANYARFFESVPLDVADRAFPGQRQATFVHRRLTGSPLVLNPAAPGCDPLNTHSYADCLNKGGANVNGNSQHVGFANDPSQYSYQTGGPEVVDPNLQPQSSDEITAGGEYEVIPDGRVGVTYTHRYMNDVIEDMSKDEANTYFIGNPGSGLGKDFPKAVRDYDAVTVYFNKAFADLWLAQVSYTWSYLRGNYAGLFRPETGQLDPNINSDFDLISLLPNRTGPLPGDRTHAIKVFGAKEFVISGSMGINLGLTYRGISGAPINYLGSHPLYGAGEAYILPRGSGGRLPWTHSIDGRVAFTYKFTKDNTIQLSADVFNIFNFESATAVDENYTFADVAPVIVPAGQNPQQAICISGSDHNCQSQLHGPASGGSIPITQADLNPNYKNPTAYQPPRTVRFGLRVTF